MRRNWLSATLILATVPLSSLSAADPPSDAAKPDRVIQKLDEIINRLVVADDRLAALERSRTDSLREVRDLKQQVDQLQRDVADLRSRMGAPTIAATGAPPTTARFGPALTTGILRVFNDYPLTMSVNVNGVMHDLLPGESRNFVVPSGSFSYQVMNVHPAPVTRTVGEGKTYFTRIHPIGQ